MLARHAGDRVERVRLAVRADHVIEERAELRAGERGRGVRDALDNRIEVEPARDVARDVRELIVAFGRERDRRDLSECCRRVELHLARFCLRRAVIAGDRARGLAANEEGKHEKGRDPFAVVQLTAGVDGRPHPHIRDEQRCREHRRDVPVRRCLDREGRVARRQPRG